MIKKKNNIYNITVIAITLLITIIVYSKLPNEMPIHWNASGEIDRYASKLSGAFLSPIIMILSWLGMIYLPKIDPKKENYKKFNGSYSIIISLLITVFFMIHMVTLGATLGYNISINKVIPFIVGGLFIIIGNYLPKSKSNFFYGIKTPWTLTSEYSWQKTHRLGGRLFVVAGGIMMISPFLLPSKLQFVITIATVCIVVIIPIVASYFYAKEKQN